MAEGNFGERMAVVRHEQGGKALGGRRPIAEKYRPLIEKTERVFARSMPEEAERYVEELAPKDPERCPVHRQILRCPEDGCSVESERTPYDHKAAAYVFDRIMGKPTTRSENTLTVRFVEQVVSSVIAVFKDVNELTDPDARQQAFAHECLALSAAWSGHGP